MTTTSARRLARTATAAAAALTAVLLAGCTTDEPEIPATPKASPTVEAEPTPEPSPTLDEAAQLKQDNIDAAKQRIVDYWAADARVANAGFENWADLEQYFMPEEWDRREILYADYVDDGLSTRGAAEVERMTVTDYQSSDGGHERVTIKTCLDYSDVTPLDRDGGPIDRAENFEPRTVGEYVLAHGGPDAWWRIVVIDATDETC